MFQPAAAAEVAARTAELAARQPMGRAPDFGGSQVLSLAEMARTWRAHRGRPRAFFPLPSPGGPGATFTAGSTPAPATPAEPSPGTNS